MAKPVITAAEWFDNCGGWRPRHDLGLLRSGLQEGLLDEQDRYGMTALSLAVTSGWMEGIEELLNAKADTEARYFRTGETALKMAVQAANRAVIAALVQGHANPDAANYWGVTPRAASAFVGLPGLFDDIPISEIRRPIPRIQDAEHLAEHHHPRFKIPGREEREAMTPGRAVDLYVYGPRAEIKQDTVKVKIIARTGDSPMIRYSASVETPIGRTHLPDDTTVVMFGPEHIASIYVTQPVKSRS